MTTLFFCIY